MRRSTRTAGRAAADDPAHTLARQDAVVTSLRPAAGAAAAPATAFPDTLFAIAPPMYVADSAGRLTMTTPAFDRLAAAATADGAGDAGGAPLELARIFERLRDGGETTLDQTVALDGATRRFRSRHVRTTDRDGRVVYAGHYADVTAEREAVERSARDQARYQDLIRSTSDWVWETDADLRLTYVSSRISEVLGVPPASLKGRRLASLGRFESHPDGGSPPPDPAVDRSPFRRRLFLMPDREGKIRRISLSGVPAFDEPTGRFVGFRGTGTDVTVRHDAEERVRKSQRELESSLRALRARNVQLDGALNDARSAMIAKTEFLGKMSHELRTPLNAIIGFAEMSAGQVFGPLHDRYLAYFEDIRGAARHLLRTIDDILDTVNIEANRVSVAVRPVRVATIIAEAWSIVGGRAAKRGIDFDGVALGDEWAVMADPARARQIFVNLLSNAVKFTEAGGGIGVEACPAGNGMLDITVWDTGIGIPGDEHARIFDSFHQIAGDVMSQPRDGTGLGLSISRQLARLMSGDISVDSAPGRGSRFTVRLPLAPEIREAGE